VGVSEAAALCHAATAAGQHTGHCVPAEVSASWLLSTCTGLQAYTLPCCVGTKAWALNTAHAGNMTTHMTTTHSTHDQYLLTYIARETRATTVGANRLKGLHTSACLLRVVSHV
jgi:hypothetical protein